MSLTWAVFEILGTVAFAFSGAAVGLTRGMDVFGIAILSVVTAVGGGILRDVLAQKVPVVLYEDVYAMASVVGGIVICVLYPLTGIVYASWGGFGVVLLLRVCAIFFGWRLYHPVRIHGGGGRE